MGWRCFSDGDRQMDPEVSRAPQVTGGVSECRRKGDRERTADDAQKARKMERQRGREREGKREAEGDNAGRN